MIGKLLITIFSTLAFSAIGYAQNQGYVPPPRSAIHVFNVGNLNNQGNQILVEIQTPGQPLPVFYFGQPNAMTQIQYDGPFDAKDAQIDVEVEGRANNAGSENFELIRTTENYRLLTNPLTKLSLEFDYWKSLDRPGVIKDGPRAVCNQLTLEKNGEIPKTFKPIRHSEWPADFIPSLNLPEPRITSNQIFDQITSGDRDAHFVDSVTPQYKKILREKKVQDLIKLHTKINELVNKKAREGTLSTEDSKNLSRLLYEFANYKGPEFDFKDARIE